MNGGHDLGGMHGLGPIDAEPEAAEPVFHHEWEQRVFALMLATGALGQWSIDVGRHARERQHPADYLRHSYYENWLTGLEKLLVERGLVSAEELASGRTAGPAAEALRGSRVERRTGRRPPSPGAVRSRLPSMRRHAMPSATGCARSIGIRPATPVSRATCAAGSASSTSTTAPMCSRISAPQVGARDAHLYSVRFTAGELWGEPARNGAVYADLWEDYLEPAG